MQKQTKIRLSAATFVMLLAVLACELPGLTASQPPPVIDADTLSTMVAGTAADLMTQTAMAGIGPELPMDTPTLQSPTETSVPAATDTPKISSVGTSLLVLADGSTQFADQRTGIQLVIPPGWLTLRVNEEEYYRVLESEWVNDPAVMKSLGYIQNLDPQAVRLTALDVRPGHILNGAITNISLVFLQSDTRTLNEWAEDQTQPEDQVKFKLLSSGFGQTAGGIETFVLEEQWEAISAGTDEMFLEYHKRVWFKVPTGTIHIDLNTPLDFETVVSPGFDGLVDNIVLLNP